MKIKVYEADKIEEVLEKIGASPSGARAIGAVMRGIAGDIISGRDGDEIRISVDGRKYKITLEKE